VSAVHAAKPEARLLNAAGKGDPDEVEVQLKFGGEDFESSEILLASSFRAEAVELFPHIAGVGEAEAEVLQSFVEAQ
ncbi:unnamed protein product, partial [Prorocentrum cordatum]